MKMSKARVAVPLAIALAVAVGFTLSMGLGSLSAIGWKDISLLCPVGALTTMLASKTIVPQALISILIAVVLVLAVGRLFCGWVCPVPVIDKIPQLFRKKEPDASKEAGADGLAASSELSGAAGASAASDAAAPLSAKERAALKSCSGDSCAPSGCASCPSHRMGKPLDSRYLVLGGGLLSAFAFGFPVFCLVCPVGLTFALIFLVIALFAGGDITWSLIFVPVVLIAEVLLFKKWCAALCPLSALMSLVGKLQKRGAPALRPAVDEAACIETKGGVCGRCAEACEVQINPRHPELGTAMSECVRCHACVEACPAHAVTMPLLSARERAARSSAEVLLEDEETRAA